MLRSRKFGFFAGIVILVFLAIPSVSQAAEQAVQVLHIDQGFIGHPVKLDILENKVRIAWKGGELLEESDINIEVTSSSELGIVWSSSYALSDKGVELGIKPDFGMVTTTGAFEDLLIETKVPFGNWKRPAMTKKDGYLTVRIGPEVQARLVVVPRGMREGTATWYKHKQCLCAASPDFPAGTKLKVSLKDKPEKSVVVKVNDYGPDRKLFPTRVIDLDSLAFKALSPLSSGKLQVTVEPLAEPKSTALAKK